MQQEKVIETKDCRHCEISFEITDKDLEFYEKVSPVFNGVKYQIPTPTLCPDCRQQRRLSFRNERNLYKRTCNATGKNIISIYSPDKPYKVYSQEEWWSDKWDPKSYGRNFDFSKSFFEQFEELMTEVPVIALVTQNAENSEYTNYTSNHKNCYLTVGGEASENCMYGNYQFYTNNSVDFYWISNCDNCYQVQKSDNCNKLFYSNECKSVSNSYFCDNCNNCNYCIGCINLNNKSYHIFNKQVTKEEFDSTVKHLSDYSFFLDFKSKVYDFFKNNIHKYADVNMSENCDGDMINSSKNCNFCFNIDAGENGKDIFMGFDFADSQDTTLIGFKSSKTLSSIGIMGGNSIYFSAYAWGNNNNLFYSNQCYNNNSNLFGCIGLRNSEYCILNRQYTREEYEALVPKIIEHMQKTGEWGEFFPSSISPFGYNETVAQEYYPLSRDVAVQCLYKWSDYENPRPDVSKIIPASKLPDDITKIPDDILNWAIECEVTGKPFRIIKQELEFYRKHHLPIPRRHPDQRHLDRMALRNPRKLFERKCDKCGVEMMTTYSLDRPERVYCEGCYSKEIL